MRGRVARASRARSRCRGRSRPRRRAPARGPARRCRRCPSSSRGAPPPTARSGSIGTPLWRATSIRRSSERSGSATPRVMCSWRGCIHSSQPGRLDDRRGEPVVVGVGVRADQQLHVRDRVARLVQRALQLVERTRLVDAGVDQHEPVAGAQRPRVHVRHARPGQRQPEPPNARQYRGRPVPAPDRAAGWPRRRGY